jgi:hypothetical protein
MKNKKNPIVIVDVLLKKSEHKGMIEKAEQLSEILGSQNEKSSSVEVINIGKVFGPMPSTYPNASPYTEFTYDVTADTDETKVVMMTRDRIEYLKKECIYLGSHYFIKQTEAFERIPFSVSTFHLN